MYVNLVFNRILDKNLYPKMRFGEICQLMSFSERLYNTLSSEQLAQMRKEIADYRREDVSSLVLDEQERDLIQAIDNLLKHYQKQIDLLLYMDRHDTEEPILKRLRGEVQDRFFEIIIPSGVFNKGSIERETFIALNGLSETLFQI